MVCSFSEVNTFLERKNLDVVAPSSYLRIVQSWVVRLAGVWAAKKLTARTRMRMQIETNRKSEASE